jgi:hypothetical protein
VLKKELWIISNIIAMIFRIQGAKGSSEMPKSFKELNIRMLKALINSLEKTLEP